MSDNPSEEEEPSIEEILASIRQIISDDEEEDSSADKEEVLEDPIRHDTDDVLELTDSMVDGEKESPEPESVEVDMRDIVEEEEQQPEPEPVTREYIPEPEAEPVIQERPSAPPSDILSSSTQGAALSSLTKLTSKMPINSTRSFDGVTLEDIVRELLHPMLREWMDDNLPPMVERLVQKELEKLTRRALDD